MNQLGEAVPEGKYLLGDMLFIDIEKRDNQLVIKMGQAGVVEITTSVQQGSEWKIWYRINKKELSATIKSTTT